MKLNKISKYPEILLFIPALFIGAGYLIMQWGASNEQKIVIGGFSLIAIEYYHYLLLWS
ncbi:MAG: hypothetical protein O8C64_05350 [Candidatus Methanoperedens sp.]|nr:hypothetical protein [Candidatus Methanoperedens sp.]MCZ7405110.1 hypothetical protein [Candidatus Methanoperedens sp.]